jgi:hypothetical protein
MNWAILLGEIPLGKTPGIHGATFRSALRPIKVIALRHSTLPIVAKGHAMPLYRLPERGPEPRIPEPRAGLRTAIEYLHEEATRLGYTAVARALHRALAHLDETP